MQLKATISMHLSLILNIDAKFQPNRVDAHRVEALCLLYTLARLSLILHKPRLSRLSTLPCYVPPINPNSPSSWLLTHVKVSLKDDQFNLLVWLLLSLLSLFSYSKAINFHALAINI